MVQSAQEKQLREAASRTGTSVGEFAASALTRAASAVLAQPMPTVLSVRDFDHLVQILEADTAPNDALQAAADDYKRRLWDGSLHAEH